MIPNPAGAARSTYRAGAVSTASPSNLVTLLYDGALAAVERAERALDETGAEAIAMAHNELTRAQDIVLELQLALDHEVGGGIAASLDSLYDFCLDALLQANLRKDPSTLAGVRTVLSGLREAWAEAGEAA